MRRYANLSEAVVNELQRDYGEVTPFDPMWLTAAISAQPSITFTAAVRSAPQAKMEAKTCSACKQECTDYTRLPPLSFLVKYVHVI